MLVIVSNLNFCTKKLFLQQQQNVGGAAGEENLCKMGDPGEDTVLPALGAVSVASSAGAW